MIRIARGRQRVRARAADEVRAERPLVEVNPAVNITDGGPDDLRAGRPDHADKGSASVLLQVTEVTGQAVSFEDGDSLNLNQSAAFNGTMHSSWRYAPPDTSAGRPAASITEATRIRMISYYLDADDRSARTPPGAPHEQRRSGRLRQHDRHGCRLRHREPAVHLRHRRRRDNPANVRMTKPTWMARARARRAPCSPNQIRKVNMLLSGRSRKPRKGRAFSQHAGDPDQPAQSGVRRSVSLRTDNAMPCSNGHAAVRGEDGIALIVTLMVLLLVSALMVGFVTAIIGDQRASGLDRDQTQAYAAAHAGLEQLTVGPVGAFRRRLLAERGADRDADRNPAGPARVHVSSSQAAGRAIGSGSRPTRREPVARGRQRAARSPRARTRVARHHHALQHHGHGAVVAAAPKCGCGARCRRSPSRSSSSACSRRTTSRSTPGPTSSSAGACTPTEPVPRAAATARR